MGILGLAGLGIRVYGLGGSVGILGFDGLGIRVWED